GGPLRRPLYGSRRRARRRGARAGAGPQGAEPETREGLRDGGEYQRRPLWEPQGLVAPGRSLGRLFQGRGTGEGALPRHGRPWWRLREGNGRRGGSVGQDGSARQNRVEARRNGYDVGVIGIDDSGEGGFACLAERAGRRG